MAKPAKPLTVIPDRLPSPELQAMRDELGTLHEIFATLNGGQIRAGEWRRAQKVLDYVDEKIQLLQVRADHLTTLEGLRGPQPHGLPPPELA